MCLFFYSIISALLVGAYLIGSIPTGYWLAKLFGVDITKQGSGNIGASNIGRVLGKKYFLPIFFIDAGKAYTALLLCSQVLSLFLPITILTGNIIYVHLLASLALLLGNAHSIFMRFKGGKGVATLVGILFFLYPLFFALVFAFCWLVTLIIIKIPARASAVALIALIALGINSFWVAAITSLQFYFLFFLILWISWRHIRAYLIHLKRESS